MKVVVFEDPYPQWGHGLQELIDKLVREVDKREKLSKKQK